MKTLIFTFVFFHGCFAASIVRSTAQCPRTCESKFNPVCGKDGKTYANQCFFNYASCHDLSLTLRHSGACSGFAAGTEIPVCDPYIVPCSYCWEPLCGVDGKTYSSQCVLDATNCGTNIIKVNHTGVCGDDQLAS